MAALQLAAGLMEGLFVVSNCLIRNSVGVIPGWLGVSLFISR